ncbi:MAG: GNAT family N-acetyltransferase [Candidatus Hermodarchaeota archaeon]|nr:GNAT family N-acetyltransferase [Candidatus Hermodarchaeota archaeon]
MSGIVSGLPEKLESQRLLIRRYSEGDGIALFAFLERNNNREFLFPNVEEVAIIKTIEEAETKVQKHAAEWDSRKRFVLGIWDKKTNIYIGEIWIEPKIWGVPSFELGWFLGQEYLGKGFATEAAQRSLEFLFHDLGAHKVIVITRDTNHPSIKLAERLGFKKEGHLREARIEHGTRYGLVYYGLLKTEFTSS